MIYTTNEIYDGEESDESTLTAESEDSDSFVIISEQELEDETDRPHTLYVITLIFVFIL